MEFLFEALMGGLAGALSEFFRTKNVTKKKIFFLSFFIFSSIASICFIFSKSPIDILNSVFWGCAMGFFCAASILAGKVARVKTFAITLLIVLPFSILWHYLTPSVYGTENDVLVGVILGFAIAGLIALGLGLWRIRRQAKEKSAENSKI